MGKLGEKIKTNVDIQLNFPIKFQLKHQFKILKSNIWINPVNWKKNSKFQKIENTSGKLRSIAVDWCRGT